VTHPGSAIDETEGMEGLEILAQVREEGIVGMGSVGGVDSASVCGMDGVNETETRVEEGGTEAGVEVVFEKGKTSSRKMTSLEIKMLSVSGW
jgi:hypothetical protein